VSDAISDFNDEVDSLFGAIDAAGIKAVGFEPQLRAMYSGRYDQQDIAEKLAAQGYETIGYVCDCDEQEPPPSGFHLENCGWLNFTSSIGCSDTGSFVNPSTGIVTLDFNVTSGTLWEHVVGLTHGPAFQDGWLVHGWVMDLISYSGPTLLPDFRGVSGSFPAPPNIGDEIDVGDSWAGVNRYLHTGSAWDDWSAQYDFVLGNNQNPSGSLWDSTFRRSNTVLTGQHLCVYRLRIIVPD
jgi:hypothetical protein